MSILRTQAVSSTLSKYYVMNTQPLIIRCSHVTVMLNFGPHTDLQICVPFNDELLGIILTTCKDCWMMFTNWPVLVSQYTYCAITTC